MKTVVIKLKEIKDVYDFVAVVTAYPGELDIVSGRYRVNAKSVMGIFALDLTKPLNLEIFGDDTDDVIKALKPFII
jgi:phosphotransferase system HPr-like phosphotransfer protein